MKPSTLPLFGLLWLPLASSCCAPTCPVLHSQEVSSDEALTDSLAGSFKDLVQSGKAWNTSANSFSVKVATKPETLASFQYTAGNPNNTGVSEVANSSMYRVANVTKVISALALLLQENPNLDGPASKYVPELAEIEYYKGITLVMLASQLCGFPREDGKFCSAPLARTNL